MTSRIAALLLAGLLALPGLALAAPEPHVNVIGLIGDRAILRVDGQQVMLRRGESGSGVTLIDIVAGEALLRIGKREVSLGMGKDTGGIAAREAAASIEIVMNSRGQFITSGMINGLVVEFLVDTGANHVSMTTHDARRLGIDYAMEGRSSRSATAGGMVNSWQVTLRSVQVGPIVLRNVQASVRESTLHAPILLGMTFLSQISLQQENNKLKMTAR